MTGGGAGLRECSGTCSKRQSVWRQRWLGMLLAACAAAGLRASAAQADHGAAAGHVQVDLAAWPWGCLSAVTVCAEGPDEWRKAVAETAGRVKVPVDVLRSGEPQASRWAGTARLEVVLDGEAAAVRRAVFAPCITVSHAAAAPSRP